MVAEEKEKEKEKKPVNLSPSPAIQRPLWQRRRSFGTPVGVLDPAAVPLSRRRRRWASKDVTRFEQLEQVGEGTYGQVWSARDRLTNEIVALKRIRMSNEREGFPLTAVREIKLLKILNHENIVNLKDVVTDPPANPVPSAEKSESHPAASSSKSKKGESHPAASSSKSTKGATANGNASNANGKLKGVNGKLKGVQGGKIEKDRHRRKVAPAASIYMVFEFLDYDLVKIMDTKKVSFTVPQVKNMTKQILKGLRVCHAKGILHRDLKGSNVLVDKRGNLKLADFGLARYFGEEGRKYTNRVVTLWYRSPELLLGASLYGVSVDMWSAGCLLAELLTGKPLFAGKDEPEQMHRIWKVCGSPTDVVWPGWRELPHSKMVRPGDYPPRLRSVFKNVEGLSSSGKDLIQSLLHLDPDRRPTTDEVLEHPWFKEEPLACPNSELNWEDVMKACAEETASSQEKDDS